MWKSLFFTFDRRDVHVSYLRDIPTSSKDKDWKKKFFYLDAGVFPREMQWREVGPKDKVKDDGPPKDAYVGNALYKRLCECPSEYTVILEGALVMAGMSLLWRDIKLYPSFQRDDEGKWSLFDFVDPSRNATLRATDRVIGEQEPDVLKIQLEQFLLPDVSADPTAYTSQPPPSGGSNIFAAEAKKPFRVESPGGSTWPQEPLLSPLQLAFLYPLGVLLLLLSWQVRLVCRKNAKLFLP
ncbi:hypothetical protein Hdeb2414_s1177g00989371 [Helianthus debilis subsp. tardiflorus]